MKVVGGVKFILERKETIRPLCFREVFATLARERYGQQESFIINLLALYIQDILWNNLRSYNEPDRLFDEKGIFNSAFIPLGT